MTPGRVWGVWIPWRKAKSPKPAISPETSAHTAEGRVQQFLAEYQTQWQIAKTLHARAEARDEVFEVFFPQWRDMMKLVTQRHFTDTSTQNLSGSFSSRPEYCSKLEDFVRSEVHGDTTYVLFRNEGGMHGKFHEYVVRAQDADFKIIEIAAHYSDPTQPFVNVSTIAERQRDCAADAPLAALPEDEAMLDVNRNFTNREVRYEDGEVSQAQVSEVGTLVTSSGVLSVWDFGWDNDDARPLARTVDPGTYPIDRVTAFGRNAAVRVRFRDETPVSWALANRVGQTSDTVGVDAGCICIVDYSAYAAMNPRDKNVALGSINETPRPAATQFALGESNVGFACDSGWGDGSYPVYWGLDAHGQVAQLVIDFSVLVTNEDGRYKHL